MTGRAEKTGRRDGQNQSGQRLIADGAAIAAMLADSRIRAGIDMDGAAAAPIPEAGLPRPFLFLGL